MENFNTYAREINAKHVLFLFDSCFSGSIFALSRAVPDIISYKTSLPVRQFITAGSADETVPDKSIFKQLFLAALQGEGDTNRDGYVTGNELGEFLQTKVVNYTRQAQHPQYGKIQDPNLDKGDFVFVPPVILPPSTAFDPSLYETEANRLAVAKAQWNKWQSEMNAGFQKAQSLDANADLPAAAKAQMWQQLLTSFANDNPYSNDDETMRREAGNRQNYWRAYQPPKVEPARTELAAPTDMVRIPAGSFMMGDNNSSYDDEKPEHQVTVDAFYLDIYEVTVKKFKDFVEATRYKTDAEKNNDDKNWQHDANGEIIGNEGMNHPVVRVSWNDAQAYAKWAKKRLPTEAEWEYAARGDFTGVAGKSKYEYPWGNEASHERANYSGKEGKDQWDRTSPVGVFPSNGVGLYDMAGNVWELCSSLYKPYPYKRDDGRENLTVSDQRVLRGGSWPDLPGDLRCAGRGRLSPTYRLDNFGFRCAQDAR